MADKTPAQTVGRVYGLKLKCGKTTTKVDCDVFPSLQHQVLLGLPWFLMEDPRVNFRAGDIFVRRGNENIILSIRKKPPKELILDSITWKDRPHCDKVSLVSHSTFDKMSHKEKTVDDVIIIIIRPPANEVVPVVPKDKDGDDVDKLVDQTMSDEIASVLREFREVFSKDVPDGRPPVRKGHEFRIELEDNSPPPYRPIYKMSPAELEEV